MTALQKVAVCLVGTLVFVGAHVATSTTVTAASIAVTTPVPVAEIACELYCEEASWCESGYHDAWFALEEYNALIQGGSHNGQVCWSGDCVTEHSEGMCEPSADEPKLTTADLETLRVAILKGDDLALRRMVETYPTQVVANVNRAAVQVVTCSGVVAHFPASSELIESATEPSRF